MDDKSDILHFIRDNDIKFIRLALCDLFGAQKNVSVPASAFPRALEEGVLFDADELGNMGAAGKLLIKPDVSALALLPWRPSHGRVARFYCDTYTPEGGTFGLDMRAALREAEAKASQKGVRANFSAGGAFYLLKTDERGLPTGEPYDSGGYMDIAPADRGENVRRDICLYLEQMGVSPVESVHLSGPGQNEIKLGGASPLAAADNAVTYRSVVRTVAAQSGLFASFDPSPMAGKPGSGLEITVSGAEPAQVAAALAKARDMALFTNPGANSFGRLCGENGELVPAVEEDGRGGHVLRWPDPGADPSIGVMLLLSAMAEGEDGSGTSFPKSREEAVLAARESKFIRGHVPRPVLEAYAEPVPRDI